MSVYKISSTSTEQQNQEFTVAKPIVYSYIMAKQYPISLSMLPHSRQSVCSSDWEFYSFTTLQEVLLLLILYKLQHKASVLLKSSYIQKISIGHSEHCTSRHATKAVYSLQPKNIENGSPEESISRNPMKMTQLDIGESLHADMSNDPGSIGRWDPF